VARVVPYVAHHDYFRLRTIRVSSDETRVQPQTLAEIAGLYGDSSLWEVDPDSIRSTLRDASWVRQATVTRHFPWQVNLSVSRRYAVAAAVAGTKAYLVDGEGVLFHEVEETAAVPDLPYLTGWDALPAQAERAARLRALLGVLDLATDRKIEVSELHMDEDRAVWLYATGIKASVRLGKPEQAATGLERLTIALAELGPLADRARVIDTDYPGRIVIRGADDKLPALLAAHTEKMLGAQGAVSQNSVSRGSAMANPALPDSKAHIGQDDDKAARRG
jgi:cell division septal protein FtsQ